MLVRHRTHALSVRPICVCDPIGQMQDPDYCIAPNPAVYGLEETKGESLTASITHDGGGEV